MTDSTITERGVCLKRLYISDLDGTLLDGDQRVSERSAKLLRECIQKGAYFTFATARTAASAVKITADIGVNVPCVLMNGVCVYDTSLRQYVRTEYISCEKSARIAAILDEKGQSAFMYRISDGALSCEYTVLDSPEMQEFHDMRRNRYDKPFMRLESFSCSADGDVIYFALLDKKERLDIIRDEIEKIGGLRYEFYRDIYNNNVWYLEIFSETASKLNGVKFLRERSGFDEIYGFGDNLNDLPLFEACDVRLAVENAKPEVKAAADFIIPSNTENGVAEWIYRNMPSI